MDCYAGSVLKGLALQSLNCTENSSGWMLYILSEFVPATVRFYFVVLTLRIRIASAPLNCFVMFSQLVILVINNNSGLHGTLMAELDATSLVASTGYGFWTLDYFHYVILPFCVSQGLKDIHVLALQ